MVINTKRVSLFTLLLSVCFVAQSQVSYQKEVGYGDSTGFTYYVGGYKDSRFLMTPDDNLMLFENRYKNGVKHDYVILKCDTAFNTIYSTRIRQYFTNGLTDLSGDVLPLPDGGFMFTNHVNGPAGNSPDDFGLFRFDSQGEFVYYRQYANPSSLLPYEMGYYSQDSILIGFRSGNRFGYLMANENGDQLYARVGYFTGTLGQDRIGLVKTGNNKILNFATTFFLSSPVNIAQPALVLYDQSGNVEWAYRYQDTLYHYFIEDGLQLPNGNFLFCGTRFINFNTGSHGFIMCVSSAGQLLWSKYFNPTPLFFSKLSMISPDSILVSGRRESPYCGVNFLVDSTSVPFYSSGYDYGLPYSCDHHLSLTDQSNNLYSVSEPVSYGGPGIVFSKSYPGDYRHCVNNPVTAISYPLTGFTTYFDFVQIPIVLNDVAPTRTFVYDYTLPSVSLSCTSTGMDEFDYAKEDFISIAPNPVRQIIRVMTSFDAEKVPYEIINQNGQLVSSGFLNGNTNELDLRNQSPGLYFMRVYYQNSIIHRKIVLTD